jgi:phosphohistidine phosphatase SixA
MKNFTVTSNRTPVIRVSLVTGTISTPHYLQVIVVGHASWIAEIAEIMAWMGSALRSSTTSDGIQLCSPAIEQDPGPPTSHGLTCRISYSMESQPRDQISLNGKCWHGLF